MKVVWTKILILLCLLAQSAMATKFINFEHAASQVDTIYDDDVFLSGFKVKFDSRVYGDLFSFSYEIVQSDSIIGNFAAFARNSQNLGPTTGSFRVFGQQISCNSYIGRNLLAFGQNINIGPGAHIGRDADIRGENVAFQGAVDSNLNINARSAIISGNIGGDLSFQGDSLTINPNTTIGGDVNYISPSRANIGSAATIGGQIDWKRAEEEKAEKPRKGGFWSTLTWIASVKGYLLWNILSSLLILIFMLIPFPAWLVTITFWLILAISGNLTILLTKPRAYAAEGVLDQRLFPSMGMGFIAFLLIPVIAIVFLLTILLAPLAMVLTMLFGIAVFIGGVYMGLYVGRRICMLFGRGAKNTPGYLCYTIGMSILMLLSFIPILGYIIIFVALMTGVGAVIQAFWKSKPESSAQAIASA